jgi:predicted ATPase
VEYRASPGGCIEQRNRRRRRKKCGTHVAFQSVETTHKRGKAAVNEPARLYTWGEGGKGKTTMI